MKCGVFALEYLCKLQNSIFRQFIIGFITSKIFSKAVLLPKIWLILQAFFYEIKIIHEEPSLFSNISQEQESLREEYSFRLKIFQQSGGKVFYQKVSIEVLKGYLKKGYYLLIPIIKDEREHLVILIQITDAIIFYQDQLGEHQIPCKEFDTYFMLKNGNYFLLVRNEIKNSE